MVAFDAIVVTLTLVRVYQLHRQSRSHLVTVILRDTVFWFTLVLIAALANMVIFDSSSAFGASQLIVRILPAVNAFPLPYRFTSPPRQLLLIRRCWVGSLDPDIGLEMPNHEYHD